MLTSRPDTFTRPNNATPYTSGDLVANDTTPGSVIPLQLSTKGMTERKIYARRCKIFKSTTSVTNASFRVHLYSVPPIVTNGDNGVWLSDNGENWLGSFDVTVDKAFSNGAAGVGAPTVGSELEIDLPTGREISGLIEARGAYTPGALEVFTVHLEAVV